MARSPDEHDVDHAEVKRRERREPSVGPLSRFGQPVTIAGFAVVIAALIWVIVASGWIL